MDIYKTMLNEIVKPICHLNRFQIRAIIRNLNDMGGDYQSVAEILTRVDRYIVMTMELSKEQNERLNKFIDDLPKLELEERDDRQKEHDL
jgi:uncharacterized protein YeeX (DUF496 family)